MIKEEVKFESGDLVRIEHAEESGREILNGTTATITQELGPGVFMIFTSYGPCPMNSSEFVLEQKAFNSDVVERKYLTDEELDADISYLDDLRHSHSAIKANYHNYGRTRKEEVSH